MTGPASTVPGPQGERGFNGTQGIQGPRGFNGTDGVNGTNGVNGTQGPQGIPGPNNISKTKVYTVFSGLTATFPPNNSTGFASAIANCNPGDTAISGVIDSFPRFPQFYPGNGGGSENPAGSYLSGIFSAPTNTEDGWGVTIIWK